MNQDEIKSNLLDGNHWLRILFMVCFGFAAWVVLLVLAVLVVVQLLISLVSGSPNTNLQKTGHQFSRYLQEIIEFLLYNRHDRPFPFADFPSAEGFTPPPPPPRAERPTPAPAVSPVSPVAPVVNPAAPAVADPAVAPVVDEVAAPVGDIADPVVDIVEPADVTGPVVEGTEPGADATESAAPVLDVIEPAELVLDVTEPVIEIPPASAAPSGPAADDSERDKLP